MSWRHPLVPTLLLVCCLLQGCPRPPPPRPAEVVTAEQLLAAEVHALQERTRELLRRQDELVWEHWTTGAAVDLQATADLERALYTPKALSAITLARDQAGDPLEARAWDQLRLHFLGEHLTRAAAEQAATLARLEAKLTFTVRGKEHPVRDLDRLLAKERNALVRQELHREATRALQRLGPLQQAREARMQQAASELGYDSWPLLGEELRRTDLDALAGHARELLEATAPAFGALLDQQAVRELRLPRDRVRLRDLPRMFRAPAVDEHFAGDALIGRTAATLGGLALSGSQLGHLVVDEEARLAKNPRPLALAVVVPTDVRVSVKPLEGLRVQQDFLHQMGLGLHAAFSLEPRFALTKLGGGAVSSAFGLLFAQVAGEPAWLERHVGAGLSGGNRAGYLTLAGAWELYLRRRTAAAVLFEHRRHQPGAEERKVAQEVLALAYLLPVEEADVERKLSSREELFESARTFEAQLLAAGLREKLRSDTGPAWWESPAAGAWLRPLWAQGNALDARELARLAGLGELSAGPLIRLAEGGAAPESKTLRR